MKEQAVCWFSEKKWSHEIISVEGHRTGKCPVSIKCLYSGYGKANMVINEQIRVIS